MGNLNIKWPGLKFKRIHLNFQENNYQEKEELTVSPITN